MSNPSYTPPPGGQPRPPRQTQAQQLIQMGLNAELFRTPAGDLYARCDVNGHWEIWPLQEGKAGFRRLLVDQFHQQIGTVAHPNALTQTIELLQAKAQHSGIVRPVFTRVAFHNDALYLDLANDQWEAVEITAAGWRIVGQPPVAFRRSRGMLALPTPDQNGDITLLRQFINIATDKDWKLLAGYLLGTLMPHGPDPHLALYGERGTAKSTATRMMRLLIDPNQALVRAAPKELRDLAVAAKHSWIIAFDNLSHLPDWLSDALCRLNTNDASSTRALYTNDEEFLFSASRSVIFNAIGEIATRGDLIDRLLIVNLTQPDVYQSEQELWRTFEQARSAILGGLLNTTAHALRWHSSTQVDPKIRLADFTQWVEAAAPALAWQKGDFTQILRTMRKQSIDIEIEASSVATILLHVCHNNLGLPWRGTPTELYRFLTQQQLQGGSRLPDDWPGNAGRLSIELKQLAPAFRTKRLDISFRKSSGLRQIKIKDIP